MTLTKKLFSIFVLSSIFFLIIVSIELFFFKNRDISPEDIYMEKSNQIDFLSDDEKKAAQDILAESVKKEVQNQEKIQSFLKEKRQENLKNTIKTPSLPSSKKQSVYTLSYFPEEIHLKLQGVSDTIRTFLAVESISSMISSLDIQFFSKSVDVRGKMKDATVKLFSIFSLETKEILSVFIHEFGHYVDIYTLQSDFIQPDLSEEFYKMSWESTKILLASQTQADFVSGYAMTNKYEDFAESFIYYILHNADFQKKAQESIVLKAKYNFLKEKVFTKNVFFESDFSRGNTVKPYYRDITKIPIDEEVFLQYIKKFL